MFDWTDAWNRKQPWAKALIDSNDPEVIAGLIRDRLEKPNTVGPYYTHHMGELPGDVVCCFIVMSEETRKKIHPAIGFLLHRLTKGEITPTTGLVRGLFSIIHDSKLTECRRDLQLWIKEHQTILVKEGQTEAHETFRAALMAYARIQPMNDSLIEAYWANLWREAFPYWWPVAFTGMRIQNPKLACYEVPMLIERNIPYTKNLLYAMWSDRIARPMLERAVAKALKTNERWVGLAMTKMVENMDLGEKKALLGALKAYSNEHQAN